MPVGGKLKLKGGEGLPKPGGVKKKRKAKAKEGHELALAEQATEDAVQQQNGSKADGPKKTTEGVFLEPNPAEDKRTEAEKRLDAHFEKYELERARKEATKSHRDKIKELNEKLANMTEHYDLFRISYTA